MSEVNYIVSVEPRPAPVQVVVLPAETVQVIVPVPAALQVAHSFVAGPPGIRGEAGNSAALSFKAATNLSGHRVLASTGNGECGYADNQTLSHAFKIIGISTQAVVAGAYIDVQASGRITEPSWSWTPDLPIFCGSNGLITQVPPTSGFIRNLGIVEDSHTIILRISEPIILA